MAKIKDIALSGLSSRLQGRLLNELRAYPDINKLINAVAGLPDLDFGDIERSFEISRKVNKIVYPEELEGSKEFDTFMQFDISEIFHKSPSDEQKKVNVNTTSPNTEIQDGNGVTRNETEERNADVLGDINVKKVSTICLYQPQNISAVYERQWVQEELGLAQDVFKSRGGSSIDKLKSGLSDLGNRAGSVAKEKISDLGGRLIGSNISGALQNKGLLPIINPNLALLFKGIRFRVFQFSFLFSPKTKKEVIDALAIIKVFKYWSTPKKDGSILTFPSLFNIKMMKKEGTKSSKENDNLFSFQPAALTNMTVDYSPNSIWSTFTNGAPVNFRVDLAFTETEIITRDKIYNPNNSKMVGA